MRVQYAEMVADSTPGRFEGEHPMTAYVHELLMGGDTGDDERGDSDCGWGVRYGRRILFGTSTGFISLEKYPTAAVAEAEMVAAWPDYCERADCGNVLAAADVDGLCSYCAQREDIDTERGVIWHRDPDTNDAWTEPTR